MKKRVLLALFILLLLSGFASAETTCKTENCRITITIHIAFAGANDTQINDWAREIENVWNQNGQTTGDCKCPVMYIVEAKKAVNCIPIPQGYHCVNVLPWNGSLESLPQLPAGPRAGERVTGYMGKTTQSPSTSSLDGDWSDMMSRPVNASDPNGEHYADAAHEAGHMMGLDDNDGGGIMSFTSGPNAKPTQAQIDKTVEKACGPNACADICCCGNGQVEKGKGEGCDPFANPTGCNANEFCCAGCCHCYQRACVAANGEYDSESSCNSACAGGKCYYNYLTGCWDCKKQIPAATLEPKYDDSKLNEVKDEDNHSIITFTSDIADLQQMVGLEFDLPLGLFSDERGNIYISGDKNYSVVTADSIVESAENSILEDPTMNVYTDRETAERILEGELNPLTALDRGLVTYEGVGFLRSIKTGFVKFGFGIWSLFRGKEKSEEQESKEPRPSYLDADILEKPEE